jgi:hypothetical protein
MSQETVVSILREKCPSDWEPILFKGHILIHLPDTELDFTSTYRKVKQQITACVKEHMPDRQEEVLFEIRNNTWNCSFKLGKTVGS